MFRKPVAILFAIPILLSVVQTTHAGLVPNVRKDTPKNLHVVWKWNEFGAAGVRVNDFDAPALVHWDVDLTTVFAPNIPPPVGSWEVNAEVMHLTNPHPGDVGGGPRTNLIITFDDALNFGPIVPAVGDVPFSVVEHPAIGHIDVYEMSVFHAPGGLRNKIVLRGRHLPAPGAMVLLGLGSLMGPRRRRK